MSLFACPVCGKPLSRGEKTYACPAGHSYDIASEGYVYLLPPNKKHSAEPGDGKTMVASRRRFLEKGYYQVFSDALNRLAAEYLPPSPKAVLDAGCGEGYYTGRLEKSLEGGPPGADLYGFDISKYAVRLAAKKYPGIFFAVGSTFHIPFLSGAADLAFNIFAPIVASEFRRVLRPGGVLILAVPGPRHLYGLKEILYDVPYENVRKDIDYPGFRLLGRFPVKGEIVTSDRSAMRDLFAMTPYFWKTPRKGEERLEKADVLRTEIQFDFLVYRKAEGT